MLEPMWPIFIEAIRIEPCNDRGFKDRACNGRAEIDRTFNNRAYDNMPDNT